MVTCFVMSRTVVLYQKKMTIPICSLLAHVNTVMYNAKICKNTLNNFLYSVLNMSVSNNSKQT